MSRQSEHTGIEDEREKDMYLPSRIATLIRNTSEFVADSVFSAGRHVTGAVLIQSPQVVKVPEGETVTFLCDLQSKNVGQTVDLYNVHWYRSQSHEWILSHDANGEVSRATGLYDRFQPSRDVPGNSYILTVRDVKLGDSAVYICGIWGKIFGNGTRLNVTSKNPPVLIQPLSVERVPEGQTARFHCSMQNAAVRYTKVSWYRELPGKERERILALDTKNYVDRDSGFSERFQPSRHIDSNSFILTISNVQPSDTAVYYCSVWGDISGNGTQLNVTSADAPVVIQSPAPEPIRQGQSARLQCVLYNAAVTYADVHWYRQQPAYIEWILTDEILNNTRWGPGFSERFQSSRNMSSNSFILTISNIQLSDAAIYYCEVRGDIDWNGTQLTVINPADAEKMKLVWIIVGTLTGFAGLSLLIGFILLRK
ncbi:uncharacterized protein [Scyliorhinus torazame]|uniref:uncharacterized protein n=1 Tax=Scyliorhinus torazame TaxID=75743 RepID=UPI003B5CA634